MTQWLVRTGVVADPLLELLGTGKATLLVSVPNGMTIDFDPKDTSGGSLLANSDLR